MPRVRLSVWQHGASLDYLDPANPGTPVRVPSLRVMTTLLLGPDPAPPAADTRPIASAVLDTGAPVSVIDGGTWEAYDRWGLIEFLAPAAALPALAIGGAAAAGYRVGRMWVGVVSPRGGSRAVLPAVPVVFQLLNSNCGLRHPVILGMSAGVLDGRGLTRTRVPGPAGPVNRYDAGPAHGQDWFLEAP